MPEYLAPLSVHVWSLRLDTPVKHADALTRCLSAEERDRLEACVTDAAQRRFTLGRVTLRHVLSLYTGVAPASLRLRRGEQGKPLLDGSDDLHFSMTHSAEHALIAVAAAEVGVDMEHDREPYRRDRIARRIFHPHTVAALGQLPPARQASAFLDAWTLREAHVKAVGGGLFRTPDVLPFEPDHPLDATPRRILDRTGTAEWSVIRFSPAPGTRAAVVVRGAVDSVLMRDAHAVLDQTLHEDQPDHLNSLEGT